MKKWKTRTSRSQKTLLNIGKT